MGLEPKVTPASKGDGGGADGRVGAQGRELATLVQHFVDMPSDQWLEAMVQILGPPPIKQPLQIDGVVIEKEPLESDGTTTGGP